MNLNQLHYFVSVAESGSFTKAASFHYISTNLCNEIHWLLSTVFAAERVASVGASCRSGQEVAPGEGDDV